MTNNHTDLSVQPITDDTSRLSVAYQHLLHQRGLDENMLQHAMGRLMQHRIDQGDLFFESCRTERWHVEDGRIKGSRHYGEGIGARALWGEKTGFAYADEIHTDALSRASDMARTIAASHRTGRLPAWRRQDTSPVYPAADPMEQTHTDDKLELLQHLDQRARAMDPRVQQVMAGLSAQSQTILTLDSDGNISADVRPLVRISLRVVARQNDRIEYGVSGGGGRFSYEELVANGRMERYLAEAVEQALINLTADPAPGGVMTVVLGHGWPGILLHEAVGHGLEGDFNRKGLSAFAGRIGEKVATEHCTVVDDGSLPQRRGSLSIDDEGTPGSRTVLIENGILRGYLQDRCNARLMGMPLTGNGRRESYAHLPMPRMTNTFMLAGAHEPEEIIASVSKGIYAEQFGGGQVDITNGNFVFQATSARLIENGKLTRPVKGVTLTGNGPEVLLRVSMVGKDLQLDEGIGVCGKNGQQVPVGVGQPTLRIDELTVGGTHLS